MILLVDFGSQTTHLIARRVREFGAEVKIVSPKQAGSAVKTKKPKGIIFSGGPSSVYEKGAPTIETSIFSSGISILGICYGLQLTAHLLGGKVVSGRKEYGPATLEMRNLKLEIAKDLPKSFVVWMSHGDEVIAVPRGFTTIGSTETVPFAFVEDPKRKIIGLQFHPEVEHTEHGQEILRNFISLTAITPRRSPSPLRQGFAGRVGHLRGDRDGLLGGEKVEEIVSSIKRTVGEAYVIGAVSGGVDSTVAGVLTAQAIGDRFIPIYVENGLMREGTKKHVKSIFIKHVHTNPIVVDAVGETLAKLKGVTNPERKRKVIGALYIELFEREMEKLIKSRKPVQFLLQGTIYSDVIESKGTKYAAKIKSHHNVGGLPKTMKLKLLEPLRHFYKDEVRQIGRLLGLPDAFVHRQVFPGPGYAIRIRGEVTAERLAKAKHADAIVLDELEEAQWLEKVYMSFPVMTGTSSTAVKGDGSFFGEVVAIRVVQSKDVMTSTWAPLPYDVLQKISSRIVNEVPGISRVVYDITTKPPATMEWE